VRVVRNRIAVLRCPARGIPFPNVTWLKGGRPLQPDDRMRLLMSGRQLELSIARESDAALYTCRAENVAGSAEMHFNLTVIGMYPSAPLSRKTATRMRRETSLRLLFVAHKKNCSRIVVASLL